MCTPDAASVTGDGPLNGEVENQTLTARPTAQISATRPTEAGRISFPLTESESPMMIACGAHNTCGFMPLSGNPREIPDPSRPTTRQAGASVARSSLPSRMWLGAAAVGLGPLPVPSMSHIRLLTESLRPIVRKRLVLPS